MTRPSQYYIQILFSDVLYDNVPQWTGAWTYDCAVNTGLIQKLCVELDGWWLIECGQSGNSTYEIHTGTRLLGLISWFLCLRELRLRCSDNDLRRDDHAWSMSYINMRYEVNQKICSTITSQTRVLISEHVAWAMARMSGRLATSYPIYIGAQHEYVRLVVCLECSKLQAGVRRLLLPYHLSMTDNYVRNSNPKPPRMRGLLLKTKAGIEQQDTLIT